MACEIVGYHASVSRLDVDDSRAQRMLRHIKQTLPTGGCTISVPADVLDRQTLLQAEQVVKSEFSQVDTLINAAGNNKPKANTSRDISFFGLPSDAVRFV